MRFYLIHDHNQPPPTAEVYVNREDFGEAVSEAIDEAVHGAPDDVAADDIERRVRTRTRTCASLAEVDGMVERDANGIPQWREAGRSHDGGRPDWKDADYRGGNAELYRQAAESLRTAGDETMAYDQDQFHDTSLDMALSLDHIDAERRVVNDEMAGTIDPCETAACAAGHVYVCARGWRSYLQRSARGSGHPTTSNGIGDEAGAELGMSKKQQWALFPAEPSLEEVIETFGIEPEDWTCPAAEADGIGMRWEESKYLAADMAVVLDTLARRCDRVNAFTANIGN